MSTTDQHVRPGHSPVRGEAPAAAEQLISLELTTDGTVKVIKMAGELDMSTTPLFTELVEAVARRCPALVVVDMADVTFLCAAGLRGLIQAREMVAGYGGRLLLRAPSRSTRWLLTLTGTSCLFPLDAELLPLGSEAAS